MRNSLVLAVGIVALQSAGHAADPPGTNAPAVVRTWTNYTDRAVQTLQTLAVLDKCPECGGPNHHIKQVSLMTRMAQIHAEIVFQGQTSQMVVGTLIMSNWLGTNLVFASPLGKTTQPGNWSEPPSPWPPKTSPAP